MSLPHMAFLVQPRPLYRSTCVFLWPSLHSTMDYYLDNQVIAVKLCCHNTPLRCSTIPLAVGSYAAKQMPLAEDVADEASRFRDTETHSESFPCSNSHHKEGSDEIGDLNRHHFEAVMTCSMTELKETLRRRSIGLANKGKVPWNKGRRHTPGKCRHTMGIVGFMMSLRWNWLSELYEFDAETCARIKERTLEAMRDPKVKRKMSEAPRTHSEQSKKKIGSSLKQLWAQRLKIKRSKEKFYSSWTVSVAEAARKGGINEDQFYWDSYEMQKKEIAGRQHQQVEKKAKERVLERIQAVKRAQVRAQNLACHSVKKRGHTNKGESRAKQKVMKSCKIRKKNEELVVSRELSLNSSLTKIEEKKPIDGQFRSQSGVMSYLHSALEKFNLEAIREEQERKTISLADQIQAAKSKRHRLSRKDPQ